MHNEDEELPGLLRLLRDYLAGVEPAWETAGALEIAFELGKAAAGGKLDAAALARLGGWPGAHSARPRPTASGATMRSRFGAIPAARALGAIPFARARTSWRILSAPKSPTRQTMTASLRP